MTNLDVSTPDAGGRGRALVPTPHPIENIFRDAKLGGRAAAPPLRISAGQHRVDVGCAARGQHRRLAAPAHRHPRTRRPTVRSRRPRRPSHDRHPAPPADPRPGPADPPRRRARPCAYPPDTTCSKRSSPASAPCPPRPDQADHGPDTLGTRSPEATLGPSGLPASEKPPGKRSPRQSEDRLLATRGIGSELREHH